ncbi:MAG TPA: hydroxyisourate hydrolase [Candidatus Didemnitutus sp.]|nr:hydroxyisourate hydrolase [Candidatus Didemnitutus sp.]
MPAKLSTHVLDLAAGRPAAGMKIELRRLGANPVLLATVSTNADGRTERPLLEGPTMAAGDYELRFFVRDYFMARSVECTFLDQVPLHFHLADPSASYHVPLLVTPWSYNTYRGS